MDVYGISIGQETTPANSLPSLTRRRSCRPRQGRSQCEELIKVMTVELRIGKTSKHSTEETKREEGREHEPSY